MRKVWLAVIRQDLQDGFSLPDTREQLHAVNVNETMTSEEVVTLIRNTLMLPESGAVLKLRNHRGSLIPISASLTSNSKSVPYKLEVVREHQYIHPLEKTMKRKMYHESMKKVMLDFVQRLERLEEKLPDMSNRQQEKIEQDMNFINGKLAFLNKRFDEAERTHWSGMFTKNPMW